MLRKLTLEDIIETTGISDAEELSRLQELEILFLSFDEIASLNKCSGLRKLSFIDNGIKKLSNLNILGATLVSLCLCDQEITTIENLNLPNLRELYLHRNLISSISGLSFCPRIKKLWLFQNKIANVDEMSSTPELEELFLQGNNISSIEGLLGCNSLRVLAVAGNPIASISDVLLLENLRSLKSLSFADIHFGKCPVSDIEGFAHLILSKFRGLNKLDGVDIKGEAVNFANDEMERQLRLYNEEMQSVEDEYKREMQIIENSFISKETHLHLLEKEMASAVKELNDVVTDGRQAMMKQLKFQESLIDKNFHILKEKVDTLTYETKGMLLHEICDSERLMFSQMHILSVLEQLYSCDASITSLLGSICKTNLVNDSRSSNNNGSSSSKGSFCLGYQPMNHNSADFQMISKLISHNVSVGSASGSVASISPSSTSSSSSMDLSIELAKLYRILCHHQPNGSDVGRGDISIQGLSSKSPSSLVAASATSNDSTSSQTSWNPMLHNERVFIVLTYQQLQAFLTGGWEAIGATAQGDSMVTATSTSSTAAAVATSTKTSANPALDLSSSADDYLYDSFEETSPKPNKTTAPLSNSIANPIPNPNSKPIGHNSSSSNISNNSGSNKALTSKSLLMATNAPLLMSLFDLRDKDYNVFHQSNPNPNRKPDSSVGSSGGDGAGAGKGIGIGIGEGIGEGVGDGRVDLTAPIDLVGHSKKDRDVLDYILRDADSILANSSQVRDASLSSLLVRRSESPFMQTFYVVLSCIVDLKTLNEVCEVKSNPWDTGSAAKSGLQNVYPMPHDSDLRNDLVRKLSSHTSPAHSRIREGGGNGGGNAEIVYSLPFKGLQAIATRSGLRPEFVGLSLVSQAQASNSASKTSSSSSSSILPTIRIMENVLEHISLPNFELEKSSFIMKNFEENLVSETRHYLDKLLEEVNDSEATVLQQSNEHILAKETALRRLKEDVERERRQQESLLRDIKYQAANPNSSILPSNANSSNNSSNATNTYNANSNNNQGGAGQQSNVNPYSKKR